MFRFLCTGLQPIKPKVKVASPQYLTLNKPGWVHCKVVSDPRAKVFWSKDRTWPEGDVLPKLEFVKFSNGSLFVRKALKSYEGEYFCNAVNSGGYSFRDVSVKVGGQRTYAPVYHFIETEKRPKFPVRISMRRTRSGA